MTKPAFDKQSEAKDKLPGTSWDMSKPSGLRCLCLTVAYTRSANSSGSTGSVSVGPFHTLAVRFCGRCKSHPFDYGSGVVAVVAELQGILGGVPSSSFATQHQGIDLTQDLQQK